MFLLLKQFIFTRTLVPSEYNRFTTSKISCHRLHILTIGTLCVFILLQIQKTSPEPLSRRLRPVVTHRAIDYEPSNRGHTFFNRQKILLETKVLSVDSTGNDSRDKNQESLQKRRNVTIEDTTENIQITRYSKTDGVKSALKAALLKCDLLKNVPDQTR